MSRRIELSIPPELRAPLLDRLGTIEGVSGIALIPGASLQPPGDVLRIDATNEAALEVLHLLGEPRALDRGAATLTEPNALLAPPRREALAAQGNEAGWEEVVEQLRRDTTRASTSCS